MTDLPVLPTSTSVVTCSAVSLQFNRTCWAGGELGSGALTPPAQGPQFSSLLFLSTDGTAQDQRHSGPGETATSEGTERPAASKEEIRAAMTPM